jgi:hypothetical protein
LALVVRVPRPAHEPRSFEPLEEGRQHARFQRQLYERIRRRGVTRDENYRGEGRFFGSWSEDPAKNRRNLKDASPHLCLPLATVLSNFDTSAVGGKAAN